MRMGSTALEVDMEEDKVSEEGEKKRNLAITSCFTKVSLI